MGNLTAGVGIATITPPVGYRMHCLGLRRDPSSAIHDDLKAKALVLCDAEGPMALVSMDIAHIPDGIAASVRQRVTELCGIPAERLMLACTHNHTTPDFPDVVSGYLGGDETYVSYRALFVDLVAGAVYEALHGQSPARFGWGKGHLPGWTLNRRHRDRPVDDSVRVLRFDDAEGQPIATVVNFDCHAIAAGGQYLWWTADYPGYLAHCIEGMYPGSVCLFLLGAHGDIAPFDWFMGQAESKYKATHRNAQRLGLALAGETLKVMQGIHTTDEARLMAFSSRISLPGRRLPWTREETEAVVSETLAANPGWQDERWTGDVDHGNSASLAPGFYRVGSARTQATILAEVPPLLEAELQAFSVGGAAIAANPGELFSELGLSIREASPFALTMVSSCTNGSLGYIPARRDYDDLQGLPLRELVDSVRYRYLYGVATARVDPGAGESVVAATTELLKRIA